MGPDPTWAYFWPTVYKEPICPWPGCFLTPPEEIFLTRGEKIELFGGKFSRFLSGWPESCKSIKATHNPKINVSNFWKRKKPGWHTQPQFGETSGKWCLLDTAVPVTKSSWIIKVLVISQDYRSWLARNSISRPTQWPLGWIMEK